MAELTFPVSPGVITREIDLSSPSQVSPTGIPAGIVGTAVRGPAFVPVTVATFQDFISVFGNSDGEKFGPIAMREWLRNAGSGTFVRVLGAGNGLARATSGDNLGRVVNAGFVVGDRLPQENGLLGNNQFAGTTLVGGEAFATTTIMPGNPLSAVNGRDLILTNADGTSVTFTLAAEAGSATVIQNNGNISSTATFAQAVKASLDLAVTAGTLKMTVSALSNNSAAETTVITLTQDVAGNAGETTVAGTIVSNDNYLVGTTTKGSTQGVQTFTGGTDGGSTLGRTFFLGAFMSASAGSTIFTDAGHAETGATPLAQPIIRGVLMAPSGVNLGLSCSLEANNAVSSVNAAAGYFGASADAGASFGTVDLGSDQEKFVLLINGLLNSNQYKNTLTASFDPESPSYFVNVFNTDPTKLEKAGHYLYAHWDVAPKLASVTGSGVVTADTWQTKQAGEPSAFLLSGALGRNTGNATSISADTVGAPNFENFEDRFSAAFTPWICSQKFGSTNRNLFKFHTLTDGAIGGGEFKISIENVFASSKVGNKYGTFDVLVRRFDDNDMNPQVIESFRGLTLDITSDNYIGKRVGDQNIFFDFDSALGSQKVAVTGDYSNVSNFVRVELSDDLKNGSIDAKALPMGFRGLSHLVTKSTSVTGGSATILTGSFSTNAAGESAGISITEIGKTIQLPVPLRESIAIGTSPKKSVKTQLTWGVQFENKTSPSEPNKNENLDNSILSFAKLFPSFQTSNQNVWVGDNAGTADVGGSVLDSDRFNNNFFSLERVQVITGSNDRPDPVQWSAAAYRRTGVAAASLNDRDGTSSTKVRFLDPAKDFTHTPSKKFFKFTLPMLGGWDGVNVFDKQSAKMSDTSARREMTDSNQQGKNDSTVASFRKAVDIMEAKQDVDIQLLAIPGMRHPSITDYALESTERRFDALYVMDIEEKDEVDSFITSSLQIPNVTNTIGRFQGRGMDSSFAAAYFPDVVITDPATRTNVKVAPSAMVLGAMSLNDSIAHPWFAPAGFTRGALASAIYPGVDLGQTNRDELYTADINPIIGDVTINGGVTIFGQKTLLAAQSSLDRVNVRRLLIDIRRRVRNVARTFLFEPNQASTIAAFNSRVLPILASVQSQGGLDRFKVQIDTSTTTQADIENNTIRGRIFLQPTRSVEFVSLDFVVSNNI